ncbi:MAG: hypothetical protein ACFFKA_14145 [Candidatus Thorarchaeota archaeon]
MPGQAQDRRKHKVFLLPLQTVIQKIVDLLSSQRPDLNFLSITGLLPSSFLKDIVDIKKNHYRPEETEKLFLKIWP